MIAFALCVAAVPFASLDAAATYTQCTTMNENGWTGEVGHSTQSGLYIKDLVEDGIYLVEVANIPWLDLDNSDSDVLRVYAATLNSCSKSYVGPYQRIDASYTTASGAANDDGFAQTFHIYIEYQEDLLRVKIVTADGDTVQSHPVYWDVAPCVSCGTLEGNDDAMSVDASTGAGTTNVAFQDKETQLSEMTYRTAVYKVFDVTSEQGNLDYAMTFEAYAHVTSGDDATTDAWALACEACSESGTQYSDGPWDFQDSDGIFGTDIQLVVRDTRHISDGGWESHHILTI
jgi:hypothetical protein